MLRKKFIAFGVAAALIGAVFIPPVRAAAESALSIFRVEDARTISVTVPDLQAVADLGVLDEMPADIAAHRDALVEKMDAAFKPLDDVRGFTAFTFSLPAELKDQTPKLYAAGPVSETLTLNTAGINKLLGKLGAAVPVDDSFNGADITVTAPPVIVAKYPDVTLSATQGPTSNAPDALADAVWASVKSAAALSDDLRAQLNAIDPNSREIYLPVIQGLGREINLGGTIGYIYAAKDLAPVLALIPQYNQVDIRNGLQDSNASALVWTKDGVVYCLTGEKTDGELAQIAGSIR